MAAVAPERAEPLGYRRAIHSLIHDANNASKISARYGTVLRRYARFAKPLA